MSVGYCPARGDVVWMTMGPHVGHEQKGRRPALVLSPKEYNGKVGMAVFCPITSRAKGYPFESPLPDGLPITGIILADQIKSFDWRGRNTQFCCKVEDSVVDDVLRRLVVLLDIDKR